MGYVYKTALAFAVAKASAARFVDIFYVALTSLAFNDVETRLRSLRVKINFYPFAYSCFRNPPGVNFIHATCDLLLLGLSILF
jgi:hypothetical protein